MSDPLPPEAVVILFVLIGLAVFLGVLLIGANWTFGAGGVIPVPTDSLSLASLTPGSSHLIDTGVMVNGLPVHVRLTVIEDRLCFFDKQGNPLRIDNYTELI